MEIGRGTVDGRGEGEGEREENMRRRDIYKGRGKLKLNFQR